jgi:2-polyprenyl-3-methyl-5-hydroxy-6-metoxy-1,4-benzoquinol methylase
MNKDKVQYISNPGPVSMGDTWFTSVSIDHFWIKRRFEIIKKLFGNELNESIKIAEIGCGTGLVQFQLEQYFNVEVDGFDLNKEALENNISQKSAIFCYDIYSENEKFKKKYDVIFLMDVIEHIDDEIKFIKSLKFMLKPDGKLLVNVPAFQKFYSVYDKHVGHIRRYNFAQLAEVFVKCNFKVQSWSYWGFTMVPLLILRKAYLMFVQKEKIVEKGISANSKIVNNLLNIFSRLEFIPQKILGSSLFIVFKNEK